jgi:hypothetical protein
MRRAALEKGNSDCVGRDGGDGRGGIKKAEVLA